jgi:hypothetical protein
LLWVEESQSDILVAVRRPDKPGQTNISVSPIEFAIAAAWQTASKELGVVVTTPASIRIAQEVVKWKFVV